MICNDFTRWLSRKLGERCAAIVAKRKPDFVIGGGEAYLSRWFLIPRNPVFNVYLHVFHKDDDDRACHDHPWNSLSLLVGRMTDDGFRFDADAVLWEVYRKRREPNAQYMRRVEAGSLVYRSATFAHRLVVPIPGVMTIFVTGPRVRSWGFWCENVGWRHWKEFTGYAQGNRGAIGKGCDP